MPEDLEDLKGMVMQLKQENMKLRSEKDLIKVKLRRAEETFKRKTKTFETIAIQPQKKFTCLSKEIENRHLMTNLTLENDHLRRTVLEKEQEIRRLYKIINSLKAYMPARPGACPSATTGPRKTAVDVRRSQSAKNTLTLSLYDRDTRRSMSEDRSNIINLLSLSQREPPGVPPSSKASTVGSPTSDIDNLELSCGSPHKEIERLESCFKEILSEVKGLKKSIGSMKKQQQTHTFKHLVREISQLKNSKLILVNKPLTPRLDDDGSGTNYRKSNSHLESILVNKARKPIVTFENSSLYERDQQQLQLQQSQQQLRTEYSKQPNIVHVVAPFGPETVKAYELLDKLKLFMKQKNKEMM